MVPVLVPIMIRLNPKHTVWMLHSGLRTAYCGSMCLAMVRVLSLSSDLMFERYSTSNLHRMTFPSMPPDTIRPTFEFVSIEKIEPS
jgi:hypothetical protein